MHALWMQQGAAGNICGANKTCKCSHLLKVLDLWSLCQSPISILVQRCELLSRPLLLSRQHCNTSINVVRHCCCPGIQAAAGSTKTDLPKQSAKV